MVAGFLPYVVEHDYAGVRLKVRIADPLAQGWYDHPWQPMPEVDLLRSNGLVPGARVFDVGAHQGVVALILAHHVGSDGEVVAVEALPHNARMCEANRDLNDVRQLRVEAAAIADRSGSLEVTLDLNAHVGRRTSTITTVRVPAVTIDDLGEKYGQPDVLFIDVEGYECHALRGAQRVLSRSPACYVEIHRGCGLESSGGSLAGVFEFFPAERYRLRVWSDADHAPREAVGPLDCPSGGRVYLVAVRRTHLD
jgi:FkbM family methyltransferase